MRPRGQLLSVIDALILGFVQGITEFLPVSSSGHLVLGAEFLGLKDSNLLFDVVVHGATLGAVLGYYRRDILRMLQASTGLVRGRVGESGRLLLLILLGSVPTGVIGLLFRDIFEALFSAPRFAACMLAVTGVILWLPSIRPLQLKLSQGVQDRAIGEMRFWHALLIGVVQGLAIIPGISRSGSTISCALLLGIERELAARFSFLLSVPAICGALLLQLRKVEQVSAAAAAPLALGFFAALVSGAAALALLVPLVRRGHFRYFAFYLWPAAAAGLFFING